MTKQELLTQEAKGAELSDEDAREAEAHRGFVREMDNSLGHAYGLGGGAVVAVLATVVVMGWFFNALLQPTLWVLGLTAALGTLFVARRRIYARRARLREQVERYCEVNDLSPHMLTRYYQSLDMYPFFAAIFEESPRRLPADQPATEH